MKWTRKILFFFGLCVLHSAAWPGAPYLNDDPEPTEYQHWEFYFAGSIAHTPLGLSGLAPQFEANYGAFPNVQLHLIAPFAFNGPEGEGLNIGYGDMEAGAKLRFFHDEASAIQIGTYPKLEIPTGDAAKGLGAGQAQIFLPLMIQKDSGPWTLNGIAAYWVNPGPGNLNWVFVGTEAQYRLSSLATVGTELFFHGASQVGQEGGLGWNSGIVLDLSEQDHLMFSLGRDIVQGNSDLIGYFGYQMTP